MSNIIEIKDLNFKYENEVFRNFNLTIKEKTWTTIIGPNGSGKSTLLKILLGLLDCQGEIKIDGLSLNHKNKYLIREKIGIVFENPDNQFVSEVVRDELIFKLENLGKNKEYISKKIEYITDLFDIKDLLKKTPYELSNSEKQVISLASSLINEPKILILDEALNNIEKFNKENVYKILKDLNITIINVTHDMEETILGDEIIILDNGNLIMQGTKEVVLREEKLFNKLGLELPFMAQLSLKLSYYDLVDDLIFDMEEMVDKLWK